MLRLTGVSKTFSPDTKREVRVLQNINLEIHAGEFVVLLGANGSGKSTLVRLLAGDIQPDVGKIYLGDQDITTVPAYIRSKAVARVHQSREHNLALSLTVAEILSLAIGIKKHRLSLMLEGQFRDTILALLQSVRPDLCQRIHDQLRDLSGGEHQIVTSLAAIQMILSNSSPNKLLLLDEHVAHLDPGSSKTVMALTSALVEKHNLTTLMVTHNLQIATEYGDRVLILKNRGIAFDQIYSKGTFRDPKELFERMTS